MEKKRILFVDDETAILDIMSVRFKEKGYELMFASDGKEAFDLVQKKKPDVIVLDVMLPKIDGFKVCGLLKADNRYKDIPIILFTSRIQEEDRKIAQEVCADAHIAKTDGGQNLLETVQKFIVQQEITCQE